MEEKMKRVFNDLWNLTNTLEEIYEESEKKDVPTRKEEFEDEIYKEYFNLIHLHFDNEFLRKVDEKIGYGKFGTFEYYKTLEKIYEETPRVLDVYQGYTLCTGIDCWGGVSAFVYVDGTQYSDWIDFISEELLITAFRSVIDQSPNNPDFGEL